MKRSSLLFLAAVISHARILPRDMVVVDSLGSCPTVTVQLQPIQYCEGFTFNTVIGPINDKSFVAIADIRTDVCMTGFTTTTIYPDTRPGCSTCTATSVSSSSNPSSFETGGTASTSTGSQAIITTSTSNAAATISTSATATTTREPDLVFGEGLPSGTVSDLPDSLFLFLAFKNFQGPRPLAKRDNHGEKRTRQIGPDTVSPLALVNLGTGLPGGLSQDDCDDSSPLLLRAGSLIQYERAVAKEQFQSSSQFGFLVDPVNPVNITFTLVNGFLQWITPDLGAAIFYDCGGSIFAAFGGPLVGCTEVSVGAIAGVVCIDRVRQTRTPNPNFIAPVPRTSSTTTTTVGPSTATSEVPSTLSATTSLTTTSIMLRSSSEVVFSSSSIESVTSTESITSIASSLLLTSLATIASSSDTSSRLISSSLISSTESSSESTSGAGISSHSSTGVSTSVSRSGSSSIISSSHGSTSISTSLSRSISSSHSSTGVSTSVSRSSSRSSTRSSTTVSRSTTQTTTSSSSASASPTTCQNLPDPYTAPNGKQFATDCTYTYYQNDIYKTLYASSFAECINDCSTDVHDTPCVAVSFGFPDGCFLLNSTRYFGYSDPSKFVSAKLLQ